MELMKSWVNLICKALLSETKITYEKINGDFVLLLQHMNYPSVILYRQELGQETIEFNNTA